MGAVIHIIAVGLAIALRLALAYFVLKNKSVQETSMAWVLMMLLFPVLGIILYPIFGKDYRTEHERSYIHGESLKRFREEISPELAAKLFPASSCEKITPPFCGLVRQNEACGKGNKVFEGNTFEMITSGARKKELLVEDLKSARLSIHMEYFRFGNDDSGKLIRDILIQKAREGVEVRFLLNSLVALGIPSSFWKPLEEAGVQVLRYTSIKQGLKLFLMRLNSQQHRKIVVIDGKVAFMGGMNINDNYFKIWQDTHLRIEGPCVARLQASFIDSWISCKGAVDKPLYNYFPVVEPIPGGKPVQIITDESDFPWPTTRMAYEWLLANAKNYVYFQTPYFVPPDSFLCALKAAALRGVDVRVMLSEKVDSPILGYFNRAYYAECLEAGVQIIEGSGRFNHAKTVLADDYISIIGSSNLDVRSFSLNSEVNAVIYDRETALRCKENFLSRMSGSKQWTLESWLASRTSRSDLASRFVRLFHREF